MDVSKLMMQGLHAQASGNIIYSHQWMCTCKKCKQSYGSHYNRGDSNSVH